MPRYPECDTGWITPVVPLAPLGDLFPNPPAGYRWRQALRRVTTHPLLDDDGRHLRPE